MRKLQDFAVVMLHCEGLVPDILKDHGAFIFRVIFSLGQCWCSGATGSAQSENCSELALDRFHPPRWLRFRGGRQTFVPRGVVGRA